MTEKRCRAPEPMSFEGRCNKPATAIIRPSGQRRTERHVCESHIVWQLRKLQNETGIDRMTVTFTGIVSVASRGSMASVA